MARSPRKLNFDALSEDSEPGPASPRDYGLTDWSQFTGVRWEGLRGG